ncbi:MAG: acyl carrier protein [Planctomycetaceae bacterium]|nr:acyl carrier protein [Planctomycetaceae bacterium]
MPAPEEIETAVRASIAQVKADDSLQLGLEDNFDDYDIDSLDRMSIMLQVEQQLGISLEDEDPNNLSSIQKYIDHITNM